MLLQVDNAAALLAVDTAFRNDVLAGLARLPKAIPARWFYDHRGSELFEEITRLPEYYPTRTERAILRAAAPEIAALTGPGRTVVEFGSGSSAKTPILLSAVSPSAYVPIDISGKFLRESCTELAKLFPNLPILPVEGDFTQPLTLPSGSAARLGFFPGSTLGNLLAPAAVDLLRAMARTLGPHAQLLIGLDRLKAREVLIPAYDDAQGVTAAFNLNLLHRINRELDGDIDVEAFEHRAIWNDEECRIEMHLVAKRPLAARVAGCVFIFNEGDTIHTENSLKYGPREARLLLRAGGWSPMAEWTDPDGAFAVILAQAGSSAPAP